MKRTFLAIITLTAFFLGCSGKADNNDASSTVSYKENISMVASVTPGEAQRVPNFTWMDRSGKTVTFSEVAEGKPVLINFWATWCGPCVKEMPDLVALSEEYGSKGALVIGISVDKDSDVLNLVADFAQQHNVKYPLIIDNGELEKAFGGLRGIPTTFYIDKNGVIAKKLVGLQSKERFAQEFDALL